MLVNNNFSSAPPAYQRRSTVVLAVVVSITIVMVCVPGRWWAAAGLSLIAVAFSFSLLSVVLAGRTQVVILGWVLMFPLGYYYLSFPREHSLVTLDRVFLGLLFITACFASHLASRKIPEALRRSAVYWAVFLVFAAVAIPRARTPMNSLRVWLEALLFPALLAWYIVRHFEVRKHLAAMHSATCVMAIYVAALGLGEVILQQDLLPIPTGGLIVAGDYGRDPRDAATQILIRPNGPFSTVNSFAIVGIVSLCFLLFLKHTLGQRMPAWQRVLHRLGVAAALAETVMPLFKSVLISLLAILLVDAYYEAGRRRFRRLGVLFSFGFVFLSLRMLLPVVFEERADPLTFYARIAQEKQTLALFMEHPMNGVGLNNFYEAAQSHESAAYKDADALDTPHNNFGAVLAETGLTGFFPFVASQILIVVAFWRIRRADSSESNLVWKTFLFLFMAFSINGLSLTIIYFGDANLWYMFVIGVIYKFAITGRDHLATGELTFPSRPWLNPGITERDKE